MTLRQTDPRRLEMLIEEVLREWANTSGEERVQQTWGAFFQAYHRIGLVAWDIEASRGNLRDPNSVHQPKPDERTAASISDHIASGALSESTSLNELLDNLEARQQIIAGDNFGDDSTPTGKSSATLVVLINSLRPIAEVIQDAAADNKSGTLDRLQAVQQREQNTSG